MLQAIDGLTAGLQPMDGVDAAFVHGVSAIQTQMFSQMLAPSLLQKLPEADGSESEE